MFIISDGKKTAISGTFPLPYAVLTKILFFEQARRLRITPLLIALELAMAAGFIYLLAQNPEVTGFTAFSVGFPCILVGMKMLLQKKVEMRRDAVTIVGFAPAHVWFEHVLLSAVLALSALWANQMQGFAWMAPTLYTLIAFMAAIVAAWPFMNYLYYSSSPWHHG